MSVDTKILFGFNWLKQMYGGLHNLSLPLAGWVWLVWLMVMFLGLGIILLFVAVVSQGALIHASAQWAKKKSLPCIEKSWRSGVDNFWPLLLVNLFKKAVLCLLTCFVGWAAVNALIGEVSGLDTALFLVLFIFATLVGMVMSFLVVYVAGYVVLEKYPLSWAVGSAWRLFLKHWVVSIEVGVIVLVLNVVVGLLALLGFFVFFLPTLITWFIAILASNSALWTIGLIVGALLFVLFIIFLGSVFTVFTISIWTHLFMKMHKVGVVSRILLAFKKK